MRILKTVAQHLSELPEPYIEMALANAEKRALTYICQMPYTAISSAFIWGDTPEGFDFWAGIKDNLFYQHQIPAV